MRKWWNIFFEIHEYDRKWEKVYILYILKNANTLYEFVIGKQDWISYRDWKKKKKDLYILNKSCSIVFVLTVFEIFNYVFFVYNFNSCNLF